MMRAREEMEKIRERTTRSLIVPVFIHAGDDVEYKILLNGIQPFNLVHPDRLVSPFMAEKCEDAKRLDDRIFEIASAVGNAILAAPKYNAAWCKLNCDAFLQLFTQYQGSRSQTVVPGRE